MDKGTLAMYASLSLAQRKIVDDAIDVLLRFPDSGEQIVKEKIQNIRSRKEG